MTLYPKRTALFQQVAENVNAKFNRLHWPSVCRVIALSLDDRGLYWTLLVVFILMFLEPASFDKNTPATSFATATM